MKIKKKCDCTVCLKCNGTGEYEYEDYVEGERVKFGSREYIARIVPDLEYGGLRTMVTFEEVERYKIIDEKNGFKYLEKV